MVMPQSPAPELKDLKDCDPSTLLCTLREKQSITFISLVSNLPMFTKPVTKRFLSETRSPILSLQTLQIPASHTHDALPGGRRSVQPGSCGSQGTCSESSLLLILASLSLPPPQKGEGLAAVLPLAGSLLGEQSPDHALGHGLWQPGAESPLLCSLIAAGFRALMLGSSATLRHPRSFCDPRDPETTLSHPGFCPPLHHLSAFQAGMSLTGADF